MPTQPAKKTLSLWLVLFVIFIDWMGIGLVYPMFSSMLFHPDSPLISPDSSNAVRSWYLGLLLASMPIAQFFSGPILGALSDQRGRRPLFLCSLVIGMIGYLFSAFGVFWESLLLLFCGRLLVGAAAGNAAVVSATVADLSSEENKGKNFGLYSMACGLGFTVGPFLGGQLSSGGFEIPFFLSAGAIIMNWLLIYFFFSETHFRKTRVAIRIDEGLKNLRKAFQMQNLRALFASTLIFCFGWSFFYEFIPIAWIHDWGYSTSQIGLAYAYGAGFYALSSGYLIRPFLTRFKHALLLFYSLALLGFTLLILLAPLPEYSVWVYLPLVNFLSAMIWPTATTMVSDFSPKDAQGETLGVYQSVQAAALSFSPLAAGPLLAINSSLPILTAAISMLLAATVFSLILKRGINDRRDKPF